VVVCRDVPHGRQPSELGRAIVLRHARVHVRQHRVKGHASVVMGWRGNKTRRRSESRAMPLSIEPRGAMRGRGRARRGRCSWAGDRRGAGQCVLQGVRWRATTQQCGGGQARARALIAARQRLICLVVCSPRSPNWPR
jgi:hypothetical protein